jgi:hypothetical protein
MKEIKPVVGSPNLRTREEGCLQVLGRPRCLNVPRRTVQIGNFPSICKRSSTKCDVSLRWNKEPVVLRVYKPRGSMPCECMRDKWRRPRGIR